MPEKKSVEFHAKRLMGAKNEKEAEGHIIALRKAGTPKAVDALIKSLEHEDDILVSSSAEALGSIGKRRAVDALINKLGHASQFVRIASSDALEKIGALAVPKLIKALKQDDEFMIVQCADTLGDIGDKRAVKPLIKMLDHENSEVVQYSAIALGRIRDERAVPALINTLNHRDSDVIRWTVSALESIGKPAVPVLIKTLKHQNNITVYNSALALGLIGDKTALPHLMKLTGHPNEMINDHIKGAIKRIQEANK